MREEEGRERVSSCLSFVGLVDAQEAIIDFQ